MKLQSFEPLERNHQDKRGLKWKYYTVLRMCSLSSFARKGSKRCRWGDIRVGHDESSHSAPWRPLGIEWLESSLEDETGNSSEWTTALSVCTHILAFISHLLFESHPIFLLAKPIPQILRRWNLDGAPETVLGGTFGGGYDQLKFPRGIVLQGGSALVWFVWSSHNENQLIIDNPGGSDWDTS